MLDTFITEISKAEIDKETALDVLGKFLLQSSKAEFNEEKLTSILPAVYSFCFDRFKSTGGFKNISYKFFDKTHGEDCVAYAYKNKVAINQDKYLIPKLDIYDRYELLDSLIHEHRHVGDYYDNNLKVDNNQRNKDSSYISTAEFYISDFIENWCSYENKEFKGDGQTRTYANQLKAFLRDKYTFDRGEILARKEAINGMGEILDHLKSKKLLTPFERIRLHELNSYHRLGIKFEKEKMARERETVHPDVMSEFRNYQEHTLYSSLPDAIKSLGEAKQTPLSFQTGKLSFSDDSERFKKISRAEDKIDNIATKIVVGLNIQYDEKLANDFFDMYMEYANNSNNMVNKLSTLINRTEFVPNESQMSQIAKFVLEKGSSPRAGLAYLMEDFYSLKPEYVLDAFMKFDKNFEQTLREYSSDFMPIDDSDKEVLILKHKLSQENFELDPQDYEDFKDYVSSIFNNNENENSQNYNEFDKYVDNIFDDESKALDEASNIDTESNFSNEPN